MRVGLLNFTIGGVARPWCPWPRWPAPPGRAGVAPPARPRGSAGDVGTMFWAWALLAGQIPWSGIPREAVGVLQFACASYGRDRPPVRPPVRRRQDMVGSRRRRWVMHVAEADGVGP